MLDFSPYDAWQLAHRETTMRMNEHLDSDEELMPSYGEMEEGEQKEAAAVALARPAAAAQQQSQHDR